jgi:cysteinyl-tRNA synthetase
MRLYNSRTTTIEPFVPLEPGKVKLYVCGPTVYGEAHIGNARPVIVFDTLRRTFEALGYAVDYVSNITDVDDKIIQKAIREGVSETVITDRYTAAYNAVRQALNTRTLTFNPKVTDTIDPIIRFIEQLVQEGFAYTVNGNVYFRVLKSERYGEISKQRLEDLVVGARIDEDPDKESPLDFALWKRTEEGLQWDSPWGKGRPGWHTECVVMINDYFKGPIDIHGGGMDLKFPHHENELAQAKACLHHHLANVWMHNGMLNIDGEKMSKSLGNVLLAKDIIAKLGANTVRWMMLSAHYRAPLNISDEVVEQAQTELGKAVTVLRQIDVRAQLNGIKPRLDKESEFYPRFLSAMEDDLNTPNAIAVIFDAIKAVNQALRQREVHEQQIAALTASIRGMLDVLGIKLPVLTLSEEQKALFAQWNAAKAAKDYAAADMARQQLMDQGLL